MVRSTEYWTLEQRVARLRTQSATARVDTASPHLGIQDLKLDSTEIAGQLLSLTSSDAVPNWPASVADVYVRGTDLVATYVGEEKWPYSPQVYWSADSSSSGELLASLDMVVSIQTSLLDTHPRIDIRSNLAAGEVLLVSLVGDDLLIDSHVNGVQGIDPSASACGILWRLQGGAQSYAEIMLTGDFRRLAVSRGAGGQVESRWELFAEFLEKGVIRRARLHSIVVPRANDIQLVVECSRAIENRPLPLTT